MKKIILVALLALMVFLSQEVSAQDIKPDNNNDFQAKSQVQANNEFVVQGTVTDAGRNTLVVMGEIIAIPEDLANSLNSQGVVKIGNSVQVKGVMSNGIFIAQKITLISKANAKTNSGYVVDLMSTVKEIFSNL